MARTTVPPYAAADTPFSSMWSTVLPFRADGADSACLPREHFIDGPDGPLALRTWGDPRLPVMVLVHGYPDNSHTWDKVAPLLARRFHVVAYDVRGAGSSFVPKRLKDYRLERLTLDFEAVLAHVSPHAPVHLVAHDWGSLQGWEFVTEPRLAGRIASYTSCSGPCLDHVGHWYRKRLSQPTPHHLWQLVKQTAKSWYIGVFHLPLVPAALWRLVLGPLWPLWMRFGEGARVESQASQTSDGVHGMKLYRANIAPRLLNPRHRVAHAPVQVLEPVDDRYVSPMLNDDLGQWVAHLTRRQLDGGHWVLAAKPELFAAHVLAYVEGLGRQAPQR